MSSSSEEENTLIPNTSTEKNAKNLLEQTLRAKSKQTYLNAYENFMRWRVENQVNTFSETVLLTYFNELSMKLQPSTLWATYSMLKLTLEVKNDVKIKSYVNLLSLLKTLSTGHKSKKSKVLSAKHVEVFLNTAPDEKYLATKVALILGITGACRGIELTHLTIDDFMIESQLQAINLPDTKANKGRTFVIKGEYLNILKKYQALRPENVATNRFFLNYQKGKCTNQVIGRNKMGLMPKQIASFLRLENPGSYTGHCFRRTSQILFGSSGRCRGERHGGSKSDQAAEEESTQQKSKFTDLHEMINLVKNAPGPSKVRNMKVEQNQYPTSSMDAQDYDPLTTSPGPSKVSNVKVEQHDYPMTSEDGEDYDSPTISSQIQSNIINIPGKNLRLKLSNCTVTFNVN